MLLSFVYGTQFPQQSVTVVQRLGLGRVHKRKVRDILEAQLQHLENDSCQVGAQDFPVA